MPRIPTFALASSYQALSRRTDAVGVDALKAIAARHRRAAFACAACVWAVLLAPSAAIAASALSTNWAGYLAFPSAGAGAGFRSVSGRWTQPTASCSSGRESFSAVWVGLGGAGEGARALEQIGTDADCTRSGQAVYSSWFELVPAGPVSLKLAVHAGDEISASVTVRDHDVLLRTRDLSTGARISMIRRAQAIDVSSADWIVEAPSVCASAERCQTLALTDFGTVAFASATAVVRQHTGAIVDPDWSEIPVELRQRSAELTGAGPATRGLPARALITATPSATSPPLGAFSVSWMEQPLQSEAPPAPTLPGFSG